MAHGFEIIDVKVYKSSTGWTKHNYVQFSMESSALGEDGADKCCVKISVDDDIYASVNQLTLWASGKTNSGTGTVVPTYRIYTFDPSMYSGIPSGWSKKGDMGYASGEKYAFTSSGLDLAVNTVYVLLTLDYNQAGQSILLYYPSDWETDGNGTYQPITYSLLRSACITGGSTAGQQISITNRPRGTYTIRVKSGGTVLAYGSASESNGHQLSTTCVKSWFTSAGVTSLKTITLTVETAGETGTTSFTLTAGPDMNPVLGTPSVSCIQLTPYPSRYPNSYLAGISKAKVAVSVTAGSNAAISSVVCTTQTGTSFSLTYNGTSGNYEGQTPGPVTKSGAFTIEATDARGMSASKSSSSITVVPYVKPSLNVDEAMTYRCNSSGTKTDGGSYYRAKTSAYYYSGLSGNRIVRLTVKEQNAASATSITSGTQTSAIQTSVASTTVMKLTFAVEDYVGYSYEKVITLDAARAWINWSTPSDGNGVSVGIGKQANAPVSGYSFIDIDVDNGSRPDLIGYLMEGMNAGAFPVPIDGSKDGSSFSKNFLNINNTKLISRENAAAWFDKPANDNTWSNVPNARLTQRWIGVRFTFPCLNYGTLIVIIEESPNFGSIWTNIRYRNNETGYWYRTDPDYVEYDD